MLVICSLNDVNYGENATLVGDLESSYDMV